MRKTFTHLAFAASLAVGASLAVAVARADDDCFVPMADWQPREAVARLAAEQGWSVRRIRIDDGCYEIHGRDSDGREIEVKVDPGTLRILGLDFEGDDHGQDRDGQERD